MNHINETALNVYEQVKRPIAAGSIALAMVVGVGESQAATGVSHEHAVPGATVEGGPSHLETGISHNNDGNGNGPINNNEIDGTVTVSHKSKPVLPAFDVVAGHYSFGLPGRRMVTDEDKQKPSTNTQTSDRFASSACGAVM